MPAGALSTRDREILRGLAARIDDRDAGARNNLGVLYFNKGMYEEALEQFDLGIEIDPSSTMARRNASHVLRELGRDEEAARLAASADEIGDEPGSHPESLAIVRPSAVQLDELLGEPTLRPEAVSAGYLAHYHQGIALRQRGRYEEALGEFTRALQKGEQRDVVEQAMAEVLLVEGRPADAVSLYDALLKRNPQSPKLWNELGVCRHVSGDLDSAVRCYARALSRDAEYGLAENNVAVAQANQGDRRGARETLQALVERRTGFPEGLCNLGLLALEEGRRREAMEAYRAAVDAAPERPAGWLGIAAVLAEEGRVGAARNAVTRAVELAPDSAEARYRLAFLLNRLGDVHGSLRETRRALAINPYFTASRLRLAIELQFEFNEVLAPDLGGDGRMEHAQPLSGFSFERDQMAAAFQRLRGKPEGEASDSHIHFHGAREHLSRGAFPQALAEIRRVALAGGDPVEAALLAGETLKRQGLEGEALERFDAAAARLEDSPWTSRHARAWLGRGWCLLALRNPTAALEVTETLNLHADPTGEVERLRGETLLALDRFVEACELFQQLAARDPMDALVRVRLGVAARWAGRSDLAREAFERAVAIDPDLVAARLELATLYLVEGRHGWAAEQGRAALSALPGYADAALLVADAERAAGRIDLAIEILVELLEEDSYHLPVILRLGDLLLESGRISDARIAFRRVLRFDPESSGAWLRLGHSFLLEGMVEEGRACRNRAADAGASDAELERFSASLEWSDDRQFQPVS